MLPEDQKMRGERGAKKGRWLSGSAILWMPALLLWASSASAQDAPPSSPGSSAEKPVPAAQPAAQAAGTAAERAAPDVSDAQTDRVQEIVVTARRREENLQNTPIAVTALTARSLEARGYTNISQIAQSVPNLQFTSTANISGSTSAAAVFIRGIGQTDFAPTTEPGVGIYLDGVYIARSVGSVFDIADIARVEVLRGPQGTLFGKNTIGGAINVTTVAPSPDYGGSVDLTTGSFDRIDAKATLNVPLSQSLYARLTLASLNQEGYARRLLVGDRLGGKHTLAGRFSLLFDPHSNFTYRIDADVTHNRGESAPTTLLGVNSVGCATCAPVVLILNSTLPANQQYTYANYATHNPYTTLGTGPNLDNEDIWGISGTGTLQLADHVSLKSITAYRDLKSNFGRDADNSPLLVVETLDKYDQWQFSQELQLDIKALDNRLDWLFGAFYFKEKGFDINDVPLSGTFGAAVGIPTPDGATTIRSGGSFDNDTYAAYTSLNFNFTDQLSLSGGARYSYEKNRFLPNQYIVEAREAGIQNNPALGPVDPLLLPIQVSTSLSRVDPKISLEYKPVQDLMLYASWSTGYKGGGFVQRIFPGRPTTAPSFGPETVSVYEAGFKSELFAHHLRFNADAFYTDYRNIQVTVLLPGEFGPRTINAGTGRIQGVEAELDAVPVKGLTFSGGLGYTDARYTRLPPTAQGLSLRSRFPDTSTWTLNASAEYAFPIAPTLQLALRADWSYRSSFYLAAVNTPLVFQRGYSLVNASIVLRANNGVSLQGGISNLFDARYLTAANDETSGLGYAEGTFAPPREWYVSLRYHF